MEGKGGIDPLLNHQIKAPETKAFFAHLHKDGKYIERDDVWINYLNRRGKLTVGFGSPGRIGPELEFGNTVGNHYAEPVLIIKPAQGNMSLVKAAQLSMNDIAAFKGNVKAIPTDAYWDKKADAAYPTWRDNFEAWKKIGSDLSYHYLGSTITFSKIGRAFGETMLELHKGK